MSGSTAKEAAALVGASVTVIWNELKRRKLCARNKTVACQTYNQKERDTVVNAYLEGLPAKKAAALVGATAVLVRYELKQRGIPTRNQSIAKKQQTYSQKERDLVTDAYMNGLSGDKAAALVGASRTLVWTELKDRGLKARDLSTARFVYHFNEQFFDTIDTEEKAYWLGFLTADGAVRHNGIDIHLVATDVEHLKKFKHAIKSDHKIRYGTSRKDTHTYHSCLLSLVSNHLLKRLNQLGIVLHRAHTARACTEVPKELLRHYWRGYVDGNGSIAKKQFSLDLCGSKSMISSFNKFISTYLSTKKIPRPSSTIWGVRYSGSILAPLVLRLLYGNASVYLQRKFERVQHMMCIPPKGHGYTTLLQPIPYKVACA